MYHFLPIQLGFFYHLEKMGKIQNQSTKSVVTISIEEDGYMKNGYSKTSQEFSPKCLTFLRNKGPNAFPTLRNICQPDEKYIDEILLSSLAVLSLKNLLFISLIILKILDF